MDAALLKRVFWPFSYLGMPVNLTQYIGIVGVFNNRNFSFIYESHFKGPINRMAVSYAVLNKENLSMRSQCLFKFSHLVYCTCTT